VLSVTQKFSNNIKGDDQFDLLTLLYNIYIFDQEVINAQEWLLCMRISSESRKHQMQSTAGTLVKISPVLNYYLLLDMNLNDFSLACFFLSILFNGTFFSLYIL
jgi:hypothetical protein